MTDAARVLLPGFAGTALPKWLARRLRDGLAGVCLFGENIVSRSQLRALTDDIREANPNAIIAIDEEGGDVTRLHYATGSPYPGNAILGRIDDTELTRAVAEEVGWELRLAGCTLAFAPDVDVNSNPDNPVIGVRSFGADSELVARHSAAWVGGLESTGVASSPKHFPGHGDTAQDSHLALPVIDKTLQELREIDLPPFRAAIDAGASTIMTSHILLPRVDASTPATLSRTVLQELLRGELGFDGVIVSDALDMKGASGVIGIPNAAVRALAAGCDLLCIGTRNTDEQLAEIETAIDAAVRAGELAPDRLDDAVRRVAALAAASSVARAAETHPLPSALSRSHVSFDTARTRGAFDVRAGTSIEGPFYIVALDTDANIAVGSAPWAPFADAWVHEGGALPTVPRGRLALVGRDNHRHEWVRELIAGARRQHPDALIVDVGWPSDDRAWADIATFGASGHVGAALLELLGGGRHD